MGVPGKFSVSPVCAPMRSRTARPWLATLSLLASQLDATNTSEAQPLSNFFRPKTMNKLTPFQHGLGAAAAHLGLLAAGAAVIYGVFVTGSESRQLATQCVQMGNSRSFCELTYFGR